MTFYNPDGPATNREKNELSFIFKTQPLPNVDEEIDSENRKQHVYSEKF